MRGVRAKKLRERARTQSVGLPTVRYRRVNTSGNPMMPPERWPLVLQQDCTRAIYHAMKKASVC